MQENESRRIRVFIEPTVVLWTTFFGLAAANFMRLTDHRFELVPLITALLATVAANLVAISAKRLASKTAFYTGVCGAMLGLLATTPIYEPDAERGRSYAKYERALVRGSARAVGGLVLGGAMGIGLSRILSRQHRRRN